MYSDYLIQSSSLPEPRNNLDRAKLVRTKRATPENMSGTATMPSGAQETPDQHEQNVETHEAYQYWGYLFKPDKTGTDKLKSLLRGLKDLIVSTAPTIP